MKPRIRELLFGIYSLSPLIAFCAFSAIVLAGVHRQENTPVIKEQIQPKERDAEKGSASFRLMMPGSPVETL